jgi:hypothetical protein
MSSHVVVGTYTTVASPVSAETSGRGQACAATRCPNGAHTAVAWHACNTNNTHMPKAGILVHFSENIPLYAI